MIGRCSVSCIAVSTNFCSGLLRDQQPLCTNVQRLSFTSSHVPFNAVTFFHKNIGFTCYSWPAWPPAPFFYCRELFLVHMKWTHFVGFVPVLCNPSLWYMLVQQMRLHTSDQRNSSGKEDFISMCPYGRRRSFFGGVVSTRLLCQNLKESIVPAQAKAETNKKTSGVC